MSRRPDEAIEILVADDDEHFRRALIDILSAEVDMVVVGEAADGDEAVAKAIELVPDSVLIDMRMPGTSGIEATRAIKAWLPMTTVTMLTGSEGEDDLYTALRAGASGYLLKDAGLDTVASSVRATVAGQSVLSPSMAAMLYAELSDPGAEMVAPLSERELEILRLVAEGRSNSEIATHLFLSTHTVKRHVANILAKLHLANRLQAVRYATRENLLGPPTS